MPDINQDQAARQLTEYLVTKTSSYDRNSPIEAMVKAEISAMARKIAAEVVAENPQLPEKIRAMTARLIQAALSQDDYLTEPVVKAVSEALAVRVRDRAGFDDA